MLRIENGEPFCHSWKLVLTCTGKVKAGSTEPSTYQERKIQGNVRPSAWEHLGTTRILHTKEATTLNLPASQEDVAQPRHPEIEVLPPSGKLAERVSELEEENLCLKWALGLNLSPLALLASLG